jgi:hypothetical protein
VKSARDVGANPGDWFVYYGSVARSKWQSIERSNDGKTWTRVAIVPRELGAGVRLREEANGRWRLEVADLAKLKATLGVDLLTAFATAFAAADRTLSHLGSRVPSCMNQNAPSGFWPEERLATLARSTRVASKNDYVLLRRGA